jgi:multidrug resistance efflux pump
LGLWLGTWEGTIDRETAIWARFYDVAGNLVLLPEEAAKSQAEVAKSQAEVAKSQAEAAKLQAEAAKLQAEAAKSREEEAQVKAARLAARLRELGENPDML